MLKVIGRFVPTGLPDHRQPFNVLTMKPSEYLSPAWEGKKQDGEEYHVAEKAWRFEPVWDGEGLPPVGCECERSWAGDKWLNCTVLFISHEIVVVKIPTREAAYRLCEVTFRPIRSKADKKRDAVGLALYDAINWNAEGELVSPSRMEDYKKAYDAIAAGKIPGVKLDVRND